MPLQWSLSGTKISNLVEQEWVWLGVEELRVRTQIFWVLELYLCIFMQTILTQCQYKCICHQFSCTASLLTVPPPLFVLLRRRTVNLGSDP